MILWNYTMKIYKIKYFTTPFPLTKYPSTTEDIKVKLHKYVTICMCYRKHKFEGVDKSKTFSFSRVVEYDTQGQTVNKSESIDE